MRRFLRAPRPGPSPPAPAELLAALSSGVLPPTLSLAEVQLLVKEVSSLPEGERLRGWWTLAAAVDRPVALDLGQEELLPAPLALRLHRVHSWSPDEVASFRAGTVKPLLGAFGGFPVEVVRVLWSERGGSPSSFLLYHALAPSPLLSLGAELSLVAAASAGVRPDLLAPLSWVLVGAESGPEEAVPLLRALSGLPPRALDLLAGAYVPSLGVPAPPLVEYLEVVRLLGVVPAGRLPSSAPALAALPGLLRPLAAEGPPCR